MNETHYVAWATTALSMPEADPGICVTSYELDDDGHREDHAVWHAISGEADGLSHDWGQDFDDPTRLDTAAADAELARHGWHRLEPWQNSGGQWAAHVEATGDTDA